jgi:GcrA cell cycle regulator
MSESGWTPDRVARLEALWSEGLSAAQVAQTLGGVTRNAVIGKLHRLGRAGRTAASVPPTRTRLAIRRPRRRPLPAPARPCPPIVVERAIPPAEGPALIPSLAALTGRHCKWPLGDPKADDFGFCGRPAGEGPYCRDHHRRAHAASMPLAHDPVVRRILAGGAG